MPVKRLYTPQVMKELHKRQLEGNTKKELDNQDSDALLVTWVRCITRFMLLLICMSGRFPKRIRKCIEIGRPKPIGTILKMGRRVWLKIKKVYTFRKSKFAKKSKEFPSGNSSKLVPSSDSASRQPFSARPLILT